MKIEIKNTGTWHDHLITLPPSKSFLNRFQILNAICGGKPIAFPENTPNDVLVLDAMLRSKERELYAADAGTAMRFATGYFSTQPGERIIRGTERMHQRPIDDLVKGLRTLGANITYLENDGFPPIKINGVKPKGGIIKLRTDVSSQFVSSILMIAPMSAMDVVIQLDSIPVSKPYTDLTIALMREFGARVEAKSNSVFILSGAYSPVELEMEKDWSSAAFFFGLIAGIPELKKIRLGGLNNTDLQGDKKVITFFREFGIDSEFGNSELVLNKMSEHRTPGLLKFDFTDHPDLVQSVVMTALAIGVSLEISGLHNLHLKETDRLEALKYNIEILGGRFGIEGSSATLQTPKELNQNVLMKVYNDHRMAMSVVPLLGRIKNIQIPQGEVVDKSFPGFWNEVRKLGLEVNEIH